VAAAHSAIGAALRELGPQIVLAALPLNILEGLAGAKGAVRPGEAHGSRLGGDVWAYSGVFLGL